MSERAQEVIRELKEKKAEEEREKRAEFLMELDVCDREYSPDSRGFSSAYPELEDGKYYKKIPIEVTDEEYAQLLELAGEEKTPPEAPGIVTVLKVIACFIFFAGFIVGLILSQVGGGVILFSCWLIAGALGSVLLALAEIVGQLSEINSKTKS